MKRACYWAAERRPTRKVRRRQAKKSRKKVGTSDEESEAVTTGGEERPRKRALHMAGDAVGGLSEARGLDTELKTQFACLRGELMGMWGELVAMGKHLGAIEEAVAAGGEDSAVIKERLEDFTEEFSSFRGALEGA